MEVAGDPLLTEGKTPPSTRGDVLAEGDFCRQKAVMSSSRRHYPPSIRQQHSCRRLLVTPSGDSKSQSHNHQGALQRKYLAKMDSSIAPPHFLGSRIHLRYSSLDLPRKPLLYVKGSAATASAMIFLHVKQQINSCTGLHTSLRLRGNGPDCHGHLPWTAVYTALRSFIEQRVTGRGVGKDEGEQEAGRQEMDSSLHGKAVHILPHSQ